MIPLWCLPIILQRIPAWETICAYSLISETTKIVITIYAFNVVATSVAVNSYR
jgi:hypothetical protein